MQPVFGSEEPEEVIGDKAEEAGGEGEEEAEGL